QGRTLLDYLDQIARQFGYFRNEVLNLVMPGIEGKSNMTRMLEALRNSPPQQIAGLPVVGFEDLRDENGRMGPIKGATDYAARNFLFFRLGEAQPGSGIAARVALRPSGTEPKAKAYVEVSSGPAPPGADRSFQQTCKAVDEQTQRLATDFLRQALATV